MSRKIDPANAALRTVAGPLTLTLLLCWTALPAGAQNAWQPAPTPTPYTTTDAPAWFQPATAAGDGPIRLPGVGDVILEQPAAMDGFVRPTDYVPDANAAADMVPDEAQFYTIEELREEMKKLAWVKGDYKIVPYGVLWGSAIYATRRTFPGFFVLFAQSPTVEGENDLEIDTRRTRLGLDVTGPRIHWFGGADSGGKVEIDFHGQFLTENQSTIQIRHAWAEVKNEDWKVMAGQNWDLMSPLLPSTVNYSVGWAGGNIGFRRMQLRLDRYLHVSDTVMFSVQGAAAQDIIPDSLNRVYSISTGVPGTDYETYDRVIKPESAAWPVLQGRLGCTLGPQGPNCYPIVFGFSGHIGEQGFDFLNRSLDDVPYNVPPADDVRIRTWSFNVDARLPLTSNCGFQGEFFTGADLGTFFGGVAQGVNLDTRRAIRSTGGWAEFWYDVSPTLHTHIGYGIDNPFNEDITARTGRTHNRFLFTNLMVDVTKKMNLGFEVSYWSTEFLALAPADSVTFEFSGAYGF